MKAVVVYESMFGNTRSVAEAIAEGLRQGLAEGAGDGSVPGPELPAAAVAVVPVTEASPEGLEVDLLVVGGPTHMRRMTSVRTREMRARSGGKSPGSWVADKEHWEKAVATGIREWLAGLPLGSGAARAAVFDTRLALMPAVGAGPHIALGLRSRGYRVDERPRCFFVESAHGPLKPGERERARAWGAALARKAAPAPT